MRKNTAYKIAFIIVCILATCFSIKADDDIQSGQKKQTLLILNSYHEQTWWIRPIIDPIALFAANDDSIHAEIYSLNNVLITDSVTYNLAMENLFETYTHKPDYLVIIGSLAFSMRNEIKEHWGDLPILLITRDTTLAPKEYYFSGYDVPEINDVLTSIGSLRNDFNFTAIYIPDFYKETIDLMVDLIPDMNEFVFFSDMIYLNRGLAKDIENYLYERYPQIDFKWVKASADRPDDMQYYFVHRMPKTGLLLSTWLYEKKNAFGYSSLVSGDLSLLNSSINPVFTLRETTANLGSTGGVYAITDSINAEINTVLSAMVRGESMRDIRFYTNKHNYDIELYYPKLIEYKLNPKNAPKDTIFIDRPLTFWEKYGWMIIAVTIIFILLIVLMVRHNKSQRLELENLRRHRNFVDKMPVPFSKAQVIYDDQNNVVNIKYMLYNQAFEKILKNNCYQVDPYLIFPNDFIAQKTSELLENGKSVSFKYHFSKTNTDYVFTLCFVGARIINSRRQVDKIDIFATDITQRQQTEEQLKLTTERLDRTLNVAHLIPWEWEIESDRLEIDAYSLFSRGVHKLTKDGKVDGDKAVMTSYEYLSGINAEYRDMMRDLGIAIKKGEISDFKTEYQIPIVRDGKRVEEWVEVNGVVTKTDEDGKPMVVTGSMKIITDRKNQEKALIDAREQATQSDRMKSAFLANMSHEIRTPLNAIVGFSSLMCETDDPIKRREFSNIISQNNDMLLALINDVLDLAKIESNSLEICYSKVNLNSLLNTICETAKMRLHSGVMLNLVVGLPTCIVNIDGNRVSQVLINMLTNATKFTVKGSITFGYDLIDNNELYFYVKDTGIGVSPENQKRLFKRFEKLNNFMQGNGLGLSISKSIVEMMGGTIGMRSRGEGKGSTFWFTIPYDPVTPDENSLTSTTMKPHVKVDDAVNTSAFEAAERFKQEAREAKKEGKDDGSQAEVEVHSPFVPTEKEAQNEHPTIIPQSGVANSASADASDPDELPVIIDDREEPDIEPQAQAEAEPEERQKVILIAEDIEGNYLLLKHLIPNKYKLIHAFDGQEAVDMFSKHHPDMVLMDINMPVMDGYQATESIRKISNTVPIVAVTAYAYASDRKRILKSGFNDYISKPVIRDELYDVLKRYL